MRWDVEYTDEFEVWWRSLDEATQEDLAVSVGLLEAYGPNLGHPHSSGVRGSKLEVDPFFRQFGGKFKVGLCHS